MYCGADCGNFRKQESERLDLSSSGRDYPACRAALSMRKLQPCQLQEAAECLWQGKCTMRSLPYSLDGIAGSARAD